MTAAFIDAPIDAEAKDGKRHVVFRGDDYAAAQWTGDMWAYPYDPSGESLLCTVSPHQIDFEPTHYRKAVRP